MADTKRGIIVLRVSSKEQAEKGFSLGSQLKKCNEYFEKHHITLVGDSWVDDRGLPVAEGTPDAFRAYVDPGISSHKLDKRLALRQIARYLKTTGYDYVVSNVVDRFARSNRDFWRMFTDLTAINDQLIFKTADGMLDGPQANVILSLLLSQAEAEIANMRQRVRDGKVEKAKRGLYPEGRVPYGLKRNPDSPDAVGGLVLVDYESRWYRQMYEWIALEDRSLAQVCDLLRANGVKTRHGGKDRWEPVVVSQMIRNPAAQGVAIARYKALGDQPAEEHPITIPAIVEPWLWQAANDRLDYHGRYTREKPRNVYLLSSRLLCGDCGRPYVATPVKARGNKRATVNYAHIIKRGHCRNHSIAYTKVEPVIWGEVVKIVNDPDKLREGYAARLEQEQSEKADQINALEYASKRLAELQRETDRLTELYTQTDMALSEYQERRKRLDTEVQLRIAEQNRITREIGRQPSDRDLAQFDQWAEGIRTFINSGKLFLKERKEVLKRLNVTGHIYGNGDLKITGWFEPVILLCGSSGRSPQQTPVEPVRFLVTLKQLFTNEYRPALAEHIADGLLSVCAVSTQEVLSNAEV